MLENVGMKSKIDAQIDGLKSDKASGEPVPTTKQEKIEFKNSLEFAGFAIGKKHEAKQLDRDVKKSIREFWGIAHEGPLDDADLLQAIMRTVSARLNDPKE